MYASALHIATQLPGIYRIPFSCQMGFHSAFAPFFRWLLFHFSSFSSGFLLSSVIYFESSVTDEVRRKLLYSGGLFVFSRRQSSHELCESAEQLIGEAFGQLAPREAQFRLPVEEYAAILSKLKPRFIHDPKSKEGIQSILRDYGCDLDKTYFDVPRLRTSTSGGYLTTGIAYAWHPHRDTWYSAPHCQLNWWIPLHDLDANDGVAFHPRYWSVPVPNNSEIYNYYTWNTVHRAAAAQYIKEDPRPLPRPTEQVEIESEIRPVCPAAGVVLFSAAQLHSTVPNASGRTRFSIDFRTVNIDDVVSKRGAPNIDSRCTGISLRDFLRASDFSRMPDDIVALYNDGTETTGDLIYKHSDS